jgi:hypothetical protein
MAPRSALATQRTKLPAALLIPQPPHSATQPPPPSLGRLLSDDDRAPLKVGGGWAQGGHGWARVGTGGQLVLHRQAIEERPHRRASSPPNNSSAPPPPPSCTTQAIDFGLAVPFEPDQLPLTELGIEGTPWWVRGGAG